MDRMIRCRDARLCQRVIGTAVSEAQGTVLSSKSFHSRPESSILNALSILFVKLV